MRPLLYFALWLMDHIIRWATGKSFDELRNEADAAHSRWSRRREFPESKTLARRGR